MDGGQHSRGELGFQHFSPLTGNAERRAKNCLSRRCAQANEQTWPDESQLGLEPRAAGSDLARVGLFVETPFPARLPFKMFYGVRHVDLGAIYPCFLQGAVEHLSSRPHERFAGHVFLVTRLL